MSNVYSWGRSFCSNSTLINYSEICSQRMFPCGVLPVGNFLSYGDSCLNDGGNLVLMKELDYIVEFDETRGTLTASAGVLFDHILRTIVPKGWFLPVTPGTKFVSLGGSIANDVHGKNHHVAGNIGHYVKSLELLRSNGERIICSDEKNSDLFCATIGGLGLTGIITKATIQLIPIESSYLEVDSIQFNSLDEFFEINQDSKNFPYTVSWLDCLAKSAGKAKTRGLYIRGKHTSHNKQLKVHKIDSKLSIPIDFPTIALNRFTMKSFNSLYFHKQYKKHKRSIQHYDPFFYPLDIIRSWNRIYGKEGFFQFQAVIPLEYGRTVFKEMLDMIADSGQGSFLSVMKTFGGIPSKGLLSFPCEGVTLCLDFPNKGERTRKLYESLCKKVKAANGRMYPAKDLLMAKDDFQAFYPNWKRMIEYKDPMITSSFWKRVTGE